jgi:Fe-S-cluster-containing hydrogenase component 2
MITIEVDKKTCVGDGKCVEICPMHILKMNAERVPEFVSGCEDVEEAKFIEASPSF